jgi:hypothetical protein
MIRAIAILIILSIGAVLLTAQDRPTEERPRIIRNIIYRNFGDIPPSEIQKVFDEKGVTLKVDAAYDQAEVDKAKAVLKAMVVGRGRRNARVEVSAQPAPPPAPPRSVGVIFTVVTPN